MAIGYPIRFANVAAADADTDTKADSGFMSWVTWLSVSQTVTNCHKLSQTVAKVYRKVYPSLL